MERNESGVGGLGEHTVLLLSREHATGVLAR